jgi:hypothetical protein
MEKFETTCQHHFISKKWTNGGEYETCEKCGLSAPKTKTTTCGEQVSYRYTWPGRDESYICAAHATKLRAVSEAMGLHLQLIPFDPSMTEERPICPQIVK